MLTAVTGINWGDEGKGRVIDLLAEHADIVVRYQGGNNAGHTVVNKQGKFVLNLLPSGILHPDVVCVLGDGMVIDLNHLSNEIAQIRTQDVSVSPKNLKLSTRATISMPWHKIQDELEEERLSKSGAAFGSNKRGIAYAYSDKYRKKTIRLGDLLHLDEENVQARLKTMLEAKNLELAGCYHQEPMSRQGDLQEGLVGCPRPLLSGPHPGTFRHRKTAGTGGRLPGTGVALCGQNPELLRHLPLR